MVMNHVFHAGRRGSVETVHLRGNRADGPDSNQRDQKKKQGVFAQILPFILTP